jgi:hypothetical protein
VEAVLPFLPPTVADMARARLRHATPRSLRYVATIDQSDALCGHIVLNATRPTPRQARTIHLGKRKRFLPHLLIAGDGLCSPRRSEAKRNAIKREKPKTPTMGIARSRQVL